MGTHSTWRSRINAPTGKSALSSPPKPDIPHPPSRPPPRSQQRKNPGSFSHKKSFGSWKSNKRHFQSYIGVVFSSPQGEQGRPGLTHYINLALALGSVLSFSTAGHLQTDGGGVRLSDSSSSHLFRSWPTQGHQSVPFSPVLL